MQLTMIHLPLEDIPKGDIAISSVDKATETQLKNIQARSGKSLEELFAMIKNSGLSKHGEMREMVQRECGLGYGDASTLVLTYKKAMEEQESKAAGTSKGDVLDEIYSGAKASLRPIHEKLVAAIDEFGAFEVAPKKGYVSLRRKRQFAMIGPVTKTRVEVGLNMKGVQGTERLIELPAGGMCQYKVNVMQVDEVDEELIAWIKQAYDGAG